ncbi:crossover junction endodeoxyribonuclease RuvC [Candidatus Microgenomates bacterium]|nr:crossover junction endodeoxyribonuclease RuvC [Candidatus Microgenomates bacterium]
MKILSIDSGLERTGYAIFEKAQKPIYVASGLIKTPKTASVPTRLKQIYDELESIITHHAPNLIVVEQLFMFKNQKTVIVVAQSQGVVQLLAAQKAIPLEFLTPLQIKQIVTGYGNADKKSVEKMVALSGIDVSGKIDDEIDAIAAGLACCYLQKNLL